MPFTGEILALTTVLCWSGGAAGSVAGPFLGVSLSLLIFHYLAAGIAATFLSLVPIFMLPFARFLHKEHVSFRAVIGTFIAVFGISLLVS